MGLSLTHSRSVQRQGSDHCRHTGRALNSFRALSTHAHFTAVQVAPHVCQFSVRFPRLTHVMVLFVVSRTVRLFRRRPSVWHYFIGLATCEIGCSGMYKCAYVYVYMYMCIHIYVYIGVCNMYYIMQLYVHKCVLNCPGDEFLEKSERNGKFVLFNDATKAH